MAYADHYSSIHHMFNMHLCGPAIKRGSLGGREEQRERNESNEQSRYTMKMSVYQVMSLIKIY